MASMTTQLAWGAVTFKDGYEKAGEIQHMKECLKWAADYFIAAHKSDFELIAQVSFDFFCFRPLGTFKHWLMFSSSISHSPNFGLFDCSAVGLKPEKIWCL